MSWADLEEQAPPDIRDAMSKRDDTDRLFLRVFGTQDGKELMGMFRQWYVEPPVATPGTPTDYAFFREGQRALVQDIEARIRRALNE